MTARSWRIAFLLFSLLAQLCPSGTASAQKRKVPVYEDPTVREVYDKLVRAINDPDRPPKLIPTIHKKIGAQFVHGQERIEVDTGLMNMCRTLGKDSLNALALFLAHELAHFYMRHESGGIQVSESEQRRRDEITNGKVVNIESEADFFAGYFGRMAGYDPLKAAGEALEIFYEKNGLPDTLDGYPTLSERKSIAVRVAARLDKLLPVFEAANNLTLVREYLYAQRCYDHIISEFPSRELLNNAGLAYAHEALYLLDSRYIFPMDLDTDTRLKGVDRGTRGASRNDTIRAKISLDSARIRFQKAMACDPTYSSAVMNLATVYILQGKPREALNLLKKNIGRNANDRTRIMAKTISALAYAASGNTKKGERMLRLLLKQAKKSGLQEIVQANIDILKKRYSSTPSNLGIGSDNETIRGIKAREVDVALPGQLTELIGDSIKVDSRKHYNCSIICISGGNYWSNFISTYKEFDGASSKKIMVGSKAEEVVREYGEPPRIVNTPQGRYYIYDYSKIMFLIGPDDRVSRWTIYAMK